MRNGMPHCHRFFGPVVLTVLLLTGLACLSVPMAAWASDYDLGLIEPGKLAGELREWAILDGRPQSEWRKGHLPGALSFSWEDYTRTDAGGVPYRIWPAHQLAGALGEWGIDEKTPIIVYGDADSSWGGEGWAAWALTRIGHQGPIRLLNGGIQAWKDAALTVESGTTAEKKNPANYRAAVRPEVDISTAELLRQGDQITLIDTRSGWEWFKGWLPGAIHLSWKDLLTGNHNRPLSAREYRELLAAKGIPLDKPIVFYCAGGIRSGYAWLIHQLAGLDPAGNFEGGTEAWDRLSASEQ